MPWVAAWPLVVPGAAAACSLASRSPRVLRALALACTAGLWALAARVAVHPPVAWDAAARWFGLLVLVLGGLSLALSAHYLEVERARGHIGAAQFQRYFVLFEVFIVCLLGVAALPNFVAIWAAVEGSTLSTILLVAFPGGRGPTEAAWKYAIVTGVGGLLALVGTLLVLYGAGVPVGRWSLLGAVGPVTAGGRVAVRAGLVLAMAGFGSKAGLVPFHAWLPDAHSEAPAPVSALLSGAKLAGGLYAFLRLAALGSEAVGPLWGHALLVGTGLLSLGLAAAAIPGQRDLKRMFAYSSIEHLGVVALGAGFGGLALEGALLHLWTHGLGKTALFHASGNVRLHRGSTAMPSARGLLATMPFTGTALVLGAVAIVGLPPFGPFWSEWLILRGGWQAGQTVWVLLAIAFLLLNLIGFGLRLPDFLLGAPERSLAGAAVAASPGSPAPAAADSAAALWTVALALVGVTVAGLGLAAALHGTWVGAARVLAGGGPR